MAARHQTTLGAVRWASEKPRAKRAKTIARSDWENVKSVLHQKYYRDDLPLKEVRHFMAQNHNLCATERQYVTQFTKWGWPGKRSSYNHIGTTTAFYSDAATVSVSSDLEPGLTEVPCSTTQSLTTNTIHEGVLTENSPLLVEEIRDSFDYCTLQDPDQYELCSSNTRSSSRSSGTFARLSPVTPGSSEPTPPHYVSANLRLKLSLKNAFRQTNSQYCGSSDEDADDLVAVVPTNEGLLHLLDTERSITHRKSSVFDLSVTQSAPDPSSSAEQQCRPCLHDIPSDVVGDKKYEINSPSLENEKTCSRCHKLEYSLPDLYGSDTNSVPNTFIHVDGSKPTTRFGKEQQQQIVPTTSSTSEEHVLLSHLADCDPEVEHALCCSFGIIHSLLVRLSLSNTLQLGLGEITTAGGRSTTVVTSSSPKFDSPIYRNILAILLIIDTAALEVNDIKKLMRAVAFFSAVRLYEDSFSWSHIIWSLTERREEWLPENRSSGAATTPIWLFMVNNMLKSSTTSKHLQLVIDMILKSDLFKHPVSVEHARIFYALLGESIQRLSGDQDADKIAIRFWTILLSLTDSPPPRLVEHMVFSIRTRTAAHGNTNQVKAWTCAEAKKVLRKKTWSTNSHLHIATVNKYLCVILSWCCDTLGHSTFATSMQNVDSSYWRSSVSYADRSRFERLLVQSYLCAALWSHEKLDKQILPLRTEDTEVVSALDAVQCFTGLTSEDVLASIINLISPRALEGRLPLQSTLPQRYSDMMLTLWNNTASNAIGYNFPRMILDVDLLMQNYEWIGDSKQILDEFENEHYGKMVGDFVREKVSSGLELFKSKSLRPVLGDFQTGERFVGETMLSSARSSQISSDFRKFIDSARRSSKSSSISDKMSWRSRLSLFGQAASASSSMLALFPTLPSVRLPAFPISSVRNSGRMSASTSEGKARDKHASATSSNKM